MKKFALIAVVALSLMAVQGADALKFSFYADDSSDNLANVIYSKRLENEFTVNNNADVWIKSTVVNTTGAAAVIGQDAKDVTLTSGNIMSSEVDSSTINDTLIANACCEATSQGEEDQIDVVLKEYSDDTILNLELENKSKNELETNNNLTYDEDKTEVNTAGTASLIGQDAKTLVQNGGMVTSDRTANRRFNIVTFAQGAVVLP